MSAMTASERRQQIARLLSASQAPISATTLSQELGVSRQIIVGDIALLRAAGQEITATARGYVIPAQNGLLRRIACIHSAEETRDELDAMVDCGCTVVDVIVEHPVYGQLTAPLHLSSRLDVDQFMNAHGRGRPPVPAHRRRASAHPALPGMPGALSASKKSWKKKASCTARSDADGDRPSIKRLRALSIRKTGKWLDNQRKSKRGGFSGYSH